MATEAGRIRRPTWRDPRLGIGIILVAASVAGGAWAVEDARESTPVWAAARTLTPGDRLTGAVVPVDVIPSMAERYLPATTEPSGSVDRVIGAGELIPSSARVENINVRSVVIPVSSQLSQSVKPGATVDLWLTPENGGPAEIVLAGQTVRAILESSGFAATGVAGVELAVSEADVAIVLSAMNDGGPLHTVPRLEK